MRAGRTILPSMISFPPSLLLLLFRLRTLLDHLPLEPVSFGTFLQDLAESSDPADSVSIDAHLEAVPAPDDVTPALTHRECFRGDPLEREVLLRDGHRDRFDLFPRNDLGTPRPDEVQPVRADPHA